MSIIKKLFDSGYKEFKRCQKVAKQVFALEEEFKALPDQDAIIAKTNEFKKRVQEGESLDDILPEAYALVREAAARFLNKRPYFVQVCGAIAIHGGNIAEMKTGEGKTLTSVMPAYLNALSGQGVHIVTVNEYLCAREANGEIGDLFRYMGLTVGLNLRDYSQAEKRAQYECDILYSTNAELGFDYLRDHMVQNKNQLVQQRGLNCAIIDEIDSILIDEARTPLIISGQAKNTTNLYLQADSFVKRLKDEDYEIDIEAKTIALTNEGISKAERAFGIKNLYELRYVSLVHHLNNALKANYIMARDKDYMVSDGEVLIIDQFTGRVLKGRQYSEGLHQAIEAKEGVEIKKETVTVATITYQNFFRMYKKLSGMTGTAKTEEEEFRDIYNMYVVEIPTNKPVIRLDMPDLIYATLDAKYKAIIQDVKERHAIGQPVLLGTVAVETSELLSHLLAKEGIRHEVLNAKNHAREAEIVEKAGQKFAVTIATNMAGRGTDIKLGEGVAELGGLAVIGSERHESRRIDNQLRGRSGRQGDPGYSRFYLSAEDELLMRFGGESFKMRIQSVLKMLSSDLSQPLESKMFTKSVAQAQQRIEGNNYDSRKNVLKYDDVIRQQREIIYKQRTDIIKADNLEEIAFPMIRIGVENMLDSYIEEVSLNKFKIKDEEIAHFFNTQLFASEVVKVSDLEKLDEKEIVDFLYELVVNSVKEKTKEFPTVIYNEFLRIILIKVFDTYWTQHIDTMSELRQGVTLQAYAQSNPLVVYKEQGLRLFEQMKYNMSIEIVKYYVKSQIRENEVEKQQQAPKNLMTNDSKEHLKRQPVVNKNKAKPNDPCPCGSGRKYKFCCGAGVKEE